MSAVLLPSGLRRLIEVYVGSNVPESGGGIIICPLSGDGSERRYFRIQEPFEHKQIDRASFIAVDGGQDKASFGNPPGRGCGARNQNESFHLIRRHLEKHGFPVPGMLAKNHEGNYYLLEDLGDLTVYQQVRQRLADKQLYSLYENIIRLLIRLQSQAAKGFQPAYCYAGHLYDRELIENLEIGYFLREFVAGFLRLPLPGFRLAALQREWDTLLRESDKADRKFFLFRDFQSKNLMIKNGQLYLIDFQGARLGPCYYDLASLLNDPYTRLPTELKNHLLTFYHQQMSRYRGFPEYPDFISFFQLFSLFRIMQNLGAYAFLGGRGKRHFFQYIEGALVTIAELIANCPYQLPAMAELVSECRSAYQKKRLSHSGEPF